MSVEFKVKCKRCKLEYDINHVSSESEYSTYVICPKCKRSIYAASDYGFGPVWPAYVYYGNDFAFAVDFSHDGECEIEDSYGSSKVKLPRRFLRNNYKHHMKILAHIHKKSIRSLSQ
jgi:NAD-dependent SIR2 family protein deacetylase